MKKLFCFWAVIIALFIMPFPVYAEEQVDITILLDQSGSMRNKSVYINGSEKTCADHARMWAQELCVLLSNENVYVHVVTFDDESSTLAEEKLSNNSESNLQSILEKLDKVSFSGQHTDHYAVLSKINQQNDIPTRNIIMISDGELDIENSKYSIVQGEKKIPENQDFVNLCEEMYRQNNDSIYLLGLGTKLDMFEMVREKVPEITVRQNDEVDLRDITRKLLGTVGLDIHKESMSIDENKELVFIADTNYERSIISIISEDEEEQIDPQKVFVSRDGEEVDYLPFVTRGVLYLYLEPCGKGKYSVSLPNEKWLGEVSYVKASIVESLELKLMKDGKEVLKEEGDTYRVNENNGLELWIQAFPTTGGELSYSSFHYILKKTSGNGDEPLKIRVPNDVEGKRKRKWGVSITLEDNATYTCCAIMKLEKGCYESNQICIHVVDDSILTYDVFGEKGVAISCEDYQKEALWGTEDVVYIYGGNEIGQTDEGVVSCDKENAFIFAETGVYDINVQKAGKDIAVIRFYIAKPPEPDCWLEKIMQKIRDFLSR